MAQNINLLPNGFNPDVFMPNHQQVSSRLYDPNYPGLMVWNGIEPMISPEFPCYFFALQQYADLNQAMIRDIENCFMNKLGCGALWIYDEKTDAVLLCPPGFIHEAHMAEQSFQLAPHLPSIPAICAYNGYNLPHPGMSAAEFYGPFQPAQNVASILQVDDDNINASTNANDTSDLFNGAMTRSNDALTNGSVPVSPSDSQATGRSRRSARPPKEDKIARPRNAWIIYRTTRQDEVKEELPGIETKEISVILSNIWKKMSREERQPWYDLARQEKEEHERMYPDYRYSPRKPSEKQKRMSKKKALRLVATQAAVGILNEAEFLLSDGITVAHIQVHRAVTTVKINARGELTRHTQVYLDENEVEIARRSVNTNPASSFMTVGYYPARGYALSDEDIYSLLRNLDPEGKFQEFAVAQQQA